MSKIIAVSVVATVMFVGSTAMADIGGIAHYQDFGTTMLNGVTLMHGDQVADSTNWATIQNNQHSDGACGLFACEDQTGFFSQVGQADGYCSLIDLDQSVIGMGTQQQLIGPGIKQETQALSLVGEQLLSKTDGQGLVSGEQIMSLAQNQAADGPMNQSSVVFGTQTSNVSGAPGATGAAGGSMAVTTSQEQMVQ